MVGHKGPANDSPGEGPYYPVYNFFRLKNEPDLYCAIAQDRPVPGFIDASWEFVESGPVAVARMPGFRPDRAHAGDRLNGFYLFEACAIRPAVLQVAA
jgi:hypothetical protein